MGHFATALKSAMDKVGWNQSDLVRETKAVAQSRLSSYLSSNELPKAETLEQMCRDFPPKVREDVFAAYVTDQIPPSARASLSVTVVEAGRTQPSAYVPGKAHPDSILRRDLDILERRALDDPNLAKALNYWAASLEGKQPATAYYGEETDGLSIMEDPLVMEAQRKVAEKAGRYKARGRKK